MMGLEFGRNSIKKHLACIRTDTEFRDVRTSVLNDSSNSSAVQAGSDHM